MTTRRALDPVEMSIATDIAAIEKRGDFNMKESDADRAIVAARAERILAELMENRHVRIRETDTENGKRHVMVHFFEATPLIFGTSAGQPVEFSSGEDHYLGEGACRKLEKLLDWALREDDLDPKEHPLLQERFPPQPTSALAD